MSSLHRYAVLFDLNNSRDWETHTRPVLIQDGYTTTDDIPRILATAYGVNVADVNVISVKEVESP